MPARLKPSKYGGKWLEFSALDTNLASFDQFLDASDLVAATFMGHPTPLTLSQPTTVDHHKVVIVKDVSTTNGRTVTSTMDIASTRPAVRLPHRRSGRRARSEHSSSASTARR